MQSYVSRLFLLVANESLKLVFIVDNGPWTTKENRSRPAELWQLMVSQVAIFLLFELLAVYYLLMVLRQSLCLQIPKLLGL